ncbi:MAG: galactose mutarotase [Oscillospiraceae bacterium]|nr:galactose mutarotase [Oscillospiraceae bacterium]MBR2978184.1 galactose mutarotase [Oscillospiraceae bacterium]
MRQKITKKPFGTLADGTQVSEYTLVNARGSSVKILDYGATIRSILVRDRKGAFCDVVLGYDTVEEYVNGNDYLGATVGRCANRIGNAVFELNGETYNLNKNDGEHSLHGGNRGFNRYMWDVEEAPGGELLKEQPGDDPDTRRYDIRDAEAALVLSRISPDGEEGYPGNLQVSVGFTLTDDDVLKIVYDAVSDKDTVVSLTNHSYFNLDGSDSVRSHILQINANHFSEIDDTVLPTGKLIPVAGTPMDFRKPKPVGQDIDADFRQVRCVSGYDHNFVLTDHKAAELYSPDSGILVQVWTDLPGMQVYSSNMLENSVGKGGRRHMTNGAICLETQLFPDSIHNPDFPSPILRAGQALHTETDYLFGIR